MCREQAEANADVLQAASQMAAPAAARRTTADMATQYMLGDLDSEPVTAHVHEQKAAAKATETGATSHVMPSGLQATAPAGHRSGAPEGVIQAQNYPSTASDRQHERIVPGMMTKHRATDVAYSQLKGEATAAEDEALQAETKALLAQDSPHAAYWDESPQAANQNCKAREQFPSKPSFNADDISISVMTGARELEPAATPASRAHANQEGASGRHAAIRHASLSRGRGGTGGQSPATVRSPLQSIQEEHGTKPSSACASSTGERCVSHHDALKPDC